MLVIFKSYNYIGGHSLKGIKRLRTGFKARVATGNYDNIIIVLSEMILTKNI